jgi:hypothetical protein
MAYGVLDTRLLAELRALEKAAAQEMEQFVNVHQLQGPDGGPIQHEHEHTGTLTLEQQRAYLLAFIDQLRDRAANQEALGPACDQATVDPNLGWLHDDFHEDVPGT